MNSENLRMNPVESEDPEPLHGNIVKFGRGRLKYGNSPGDPSKSPRCGAKTRSGSPCRAPAMRSRKTGTYTKCRLHGGCSTGPRTPEGLEHSRRANWRHGEFSAQFKRERRELKAYIAWYNAEMQALWREFRALQKAFRREGVTPPTVPAISLLAIDKRRP